MTRRSDELADRMLAQLRPELVAMIDALPPTGVRKLEAVLSDGTGGAAAALMLLGDEVAKVDPIPMKRGAGDMPGVPPTRAEAVRERARARSPRSGTANRAR